MHDTIKDVINSGRYELNDMLHKIDTLWVQGDLDAYPAGWQVQE